MIPSKASIRRILIVKLRAMGDTILSLPSLAALRQGFPGAGLTALVPSHSVEILAHEPGLEEVISYPRGELNSLDDHADYFHRLQDRHFDLAVCLHASFRTALLGWFSGAKWRVVRNHSGPDWFGNVACPIPKEPKSIIQRDFDALRALGLNPTRETPSMFLSARARREAGLFWRSAGLGRGRVVALMPGAGKAEKKWPFENFIHLARALKARGWRPLWVSAPGEDLGLPGDLRGSPRASFGSLQVLGAVLSLAAGAIGNDSGPRHLAAACGTRTLTLFGPEGLREWHPYRREAGHWALKPESGRIRDLQTSQVLVEALHWLRSGERN